MLRIGYPSGFWSDDQAAPMRTLTNPPAVDYLAMDYLAEFTMPILRHLKRKDPDQGYVPEFVDLLDDLLPELLDRGVALVTNAGGLNPESCRDAVLDVASSHDRSASVAAVSGDDLLGDIDALREDGVDLSNVDTGEAFAAVAGDIVSANAYLGGEPVAAALEAGADVVVTGRCADPSLALGPMLFEFDWDRTDYDRLAAGVFAGHLLECGVQSAGGIFMDGWADVDYDEMGYPIVEMDADGSFTLTKSEGTGGTITAETVKEQMVYEIQDPERYLQPDVTTDFTAPTIEDLGDDRVAVTGCRGRPPPDSLKVVALYADGYKADQLVLYSWPDALEKARRADEIVRRRVERDDDVILDEIRTEFLGYDGAFGAIADPPEDPNEIVLRLAVKSQDESSIAGFWKHVLTLNLAGPPNVAPLDERRPKAQKVLGVWPCTVPRDAVDPQVDVASVGGDVA